MQAGFVFQGMHVHYYCAINKWLLYQVRWLCSSNFSEPSLPMLFAFGIAPPNQSKAGLPCVSEIARLRSCNIFVV